MKHEIRLGKHILIEFERSKVRGRVIEKSGGVRFESETNTRSLIAKGSVREEIRARMGDC